MLRAWVQEKHKRAVRGSATKVRLLHDFSGRYMV
jgi:hypothetical protein